MRILLVWIATFLTLIGMPLVASGNDEIDSAAIAFGSYPFARGVRLSPDGQRVSFLTQHTSDVPIAMIVDLQDGKGNIFLASETKKKLNIQWCDWANDSRLLCSFYGLQKFRGTIATTTRLVAVDSDASDIKVLAQRQQKDEYSFQQDQIVDWLPEDRSRILLQVREDDGKGVSSVDIYKNKLKMAERPAGGVWEWMSNGRGELLLRLHISKRGNTWRYRATEEEQWRVLHKTKAGDIEDSFEPIGFGDDPTKLLAWDQHEGRRALWSIDLANELERELVYSHPQVDLSDVHYLGRNRRLVGVTYSTDKPTVDYFDQPVRNVVDRVSAQMPGMLLHVLSESWDKRFYLIEISSDIQPGTYYRFDIQTSELAKIVDAYPKLEGRDLAPATPVEYPSDDEVMIPGYLTIADDGESGPRPTILMPHGGPWSRDEWGFDWLAQFLASQGYAVLQANYRGSGGYGKDWAGDGAYKEWKRAMTDLDYGLRYLIDNGIADPERICSVGWSYGGYAALMSAIEYPDRHRCVVSIAGVTDLYQLVSEARSEARYRVGTTDKEVKNLIGRDPAVIKLGSPQDRADELQVPVLLFHGDEDINVDVAHSRKMKKALRKKDVTYTEYEDQDHQIPREKNRIDMLNQVGEFLEKNLREAPKSDG